MLLGCDTGCLCLQFDLLAVLIGTGLEENIITFFSLETCNAVSQYDLVVITDMGLGGRIGNGSCKIIFSINLILLFLKIKARLLKEHKVLQEDERYLVLPLLFVCTSQHRPLRVRNPIRCNRRILSQPCFYRSYSVPVSVRCAAQKPSSLSVRSIPLSLTECSL